MVLTLGTEVPSTPADGLVNTIWVPSIKNIQKPTAAEINAGTTPSQESISDQRENSAQDYENPGRKKISGPNVEVIDNTNTSHSTQNAAMETLIEGAEGYFVRRYGKQTDKTFVAGDIVNVYAVRIGMSAKMAIAANSVLRSKVNFSVRAPGWAENVKVA